MTATALPDRPVHVESPAEFRPRPSSLAVAAIHAHGFTVADTRILEQIASHARFAMTQDERRWKAKPGELFSHAKAKTIAAELGLADARTVRRAVRSAREAGLLEVRQCDRTRRAYVWILPAIRATIRPTILAVREPRTEPQREPEREPARITPRQVDLYLAMLIERGLLDAGLVDGTRAVVAKWTAAKLAAKIRGLKDGTISRPVTTDSLIRQGYKVAK